MFRGTVIALVVVCGIALASSASADAPVDSAKGRGAFVFPIAEGQPFVYHFQLSVHSETAGWSIADGKFSFERFNAAGVSQGRTQATAICLSVTTVGPVREATIIGDVLSTTDPVFTQDTVLLEVRDSDAPNIPDGARVFGATGDNVDQCPPPTGATFDLTSGDVQIFDQ